MMMSSSGYLVAEPDPPVLRADCDANQFGAEPAGSGVEATGGAPRPTDAGVSERTAIGPTCLNRPKSGSSTSATEPAAAACSHSRKACGERNGLAPTSSAEKMA